MVSRKEIEEKRRKDEMEAAHVFEEFIETFQSTSNKPVTKTWIKAGIINPDKKETTDTSSNTLYKPLPRFKLLQDKVSVVQAQECARILHVDRKNDRKKSNLESFKEELELIHKDREERQKIKEELKFIPRLENDLSFYSEQNEPHSTNLYVNNLNPKVTEQQLMELFGKYGPLGSVKIMWPRSDEERNRNKNCGFVAFMSRKDAERALKYTNNQVILDCELKVGWGKTVLLPNHPIYIPPQLLELSLPPPESGLPFNAQPPNAFKSEYFEEYLQNSVVRVVIPTDRILLTLIHRMVEFVVREGVLFEAIMMTREINNPSFRFLFDNHCPAHIYYRWKLYSVAYGDNVREWPTKEFRMFKGGSIWKPPIIPSYSQGMPEELFEPEEKAFVQLKKTLSNIQRDHLEYIIHKLSPERNAIADAMIFCINHIDAFEEISECMAQSLERITLPIKQIIARLYLISDVLYNSKSKPDTFMKAFEIHLPNTMKTMCLIYEQLVNEEKQIFFLKISKIFNGWTHWNFFPKSFMEYLYRIFTNTDVHSNHETSKVKMNIEVTLPEEPTKTISSEDLDQQKLPGFIPSRWETVDPDTIESQAMTTSKWSQLQDLDPDYTISKTKTKTLSEDKRKKLREIELKVMEFEDKLESKKSRNITEQVENYRRKLIKQFEDKENDKKINKRRKDRNSPKEKKKRNF